MLKNDSQKVQLTDRYNKFRHMQGNREINERNVLRIMDSIKKIGWIPNPILVTPKLEVIDGQHRLEALKRLNLPVEYIVIDGATADVVREMNDKQFRWKAEDFSRSFAEEGRTSYQFVTHLAKKYDVTSAIVMRAANKERRVEKWNSGELLFTADDYHNADEKLAQYKELEKAFEAHRKHGAAFICGVFFLIENGYNLTEIGKSERKNGDSTVRFYNVKMFLEYVEKIYNYRRPQESRIYPMTEFKKTSNYMRHHTQYGG